MYSAMSDLVVMLKCAIMAISSAHVTSIAINKPIEAEDLGGWKLLTGVSGLADMAVDTDEQAMDAIKKFLSYLPSHNMQPPPEYPVPAGSDEASKTIFDILPESRNKVYDVRKIIAAVADKDSMFELKERFGKSISTVLARLDGKSVGFIANNPMYKGGALDADAVGDLTDLEGLGEARTLTTNADALEKLNTALVTFDDLDVHLDGVAGTEGGNVVAE
jgi:acetyl-CoA carboxylase carboxyltransferase component